MRMLSGYYRTDADVHLDTQKSICINSVGLSRIEELPSHQTDRPQGREDLQLLYVAAGKAYFSFDGEEQTAGPGELAVYYPHVPQSYRYHREDLPTICWVHFTGSEAENMLCQAGFTQSGLWQVGSRNRYVQLFERMINELQLQREFFLEIANGCLTELLFYFGRGLAGGGQPPSSQVQLVEKALQQFHQQYSQPFSVEDFASENGMSTCWFIRSFKEHTGQTPLQYLTSVRIRQGQEFLENQNLTVGQIAEMVGYSNPFYFSRQFKNNTGLSPTEYRKTYWKST